MKKKQRRRAPNKIELPEIKVGEPTVSGESNSAEDQITVEKQQKFITKSSKKTEKKLSHGKTTSSILLRTVLQR